MSNPVITESVDLLQKISKLQDYVSEMRGFAISMRTELSAKDYPSDWVNRGMQPIECWLINQEEELACLMLKAQSE